MLWLRQVGSVVRAGRVAKVPRPAIDRCPVNKTGQVNECRRPACTNGVGIEPGDRIDRVRPVERAGGRLPGGGVRKFSNKKHPVVAGAGKHVAGLQGAKGDIPRAAAGVVKIPYGGAGDVIARDYGFVAAVVAVAIAHLLKVNGAGTARAVRKNAAANARATEYGNGIGQVCTPVLIGHTHLISSEVGRGVLRAVGSYGVAVLQPLKSISGLSISGVKPGGRRQVAKSIGVRGGNADFRRFIAADEKEGVFRATIKVGHYGAVKTRAKVRGVLQGNDVAHLIQPKVAVERGRGLNHSRFLRAEHIRVVHDRLRQAIDGHLKDSDLVTGFHCNRGKAGIVPADDNIGTSIFIDDGACTGRADAPIVVQPFDIRHAVGGDFLVAGFVRPADLKFRKGIQSNECVGRSAAQHTFLPHADLVGWGRAKAYVDRVANTGGKGPAVVDGPEKAGAVQVRCGLVGVNLPRANLPGALYIFNRWHGRQHSEYGRGLHQAVPASGFGGGGHFVEPICKVEGEGPGTGNAVVDRNGIPGGILEHPGGGGGAAAGDAQGIKGYGVARTGFHWRFYQKPRCDAYREGVSNHAAQVAVVEFHGDPLGLIGQEVGPFHHDFVGALPLQDGAKRADRPRHGSAFVGRYAVHAGRCPADIGRAANGNGVGQNGDLGFKDTGAAARIRAIAHFKLYGT